MHRGLGAGIDSAAVERDHAEVGPDVDDLSAALRDHDARRCLAGEKHAFHRRIHRLVVFVFGDIQGRPGSGPPGVVHENVDAAEHVFGRRDHRTNLVDLRDIHQDNRRLAAEALDLGLHGFDFFVAAVRVLGQHHMRACLRQAERDCLANALRGARDDGNLVL